MDGFAFLIAAVTFVMVLVALNKISKLESRLAQLRLDLTKAREDVASLRAGVPSPVEVGFPGIEEQAVPVVGELPLETPADVIPEQARELSPEERQAAYFSGEPATEEATPAEPVLSETPVPEEPLAELPPQSVRPSQGRDVEQALASRWFVWIGGLAIAIGGVLFVKYAYDNNLIPPALQIILGLLAGAVLVAAGEFVRRRSGAIMEHSYVPAALSAGGLVTAFGSIYAAYALYELIAPTTAFVGLAAVALGALALSRLQGPLIAALGLLGSYGTPAMIPSEHPSAWSFFPYLVVIHAASFLTLRGKTWWWLGYCAIAGSTVWALLWMVGRPFDMTEIWPIGLFAHAVGLLSFFGISGLRALRSDERSSPADSALAIGLAGLMAQVALLMVLVFQSAHDGVALALFFAAAVLLVVIAWSRALLAPLAALSALLSLGVLMGWPEVAFHALAMDENGLWSTVPGLAAPQFLRWSLAAGLAFAIVGSVGARLKQASLLWGALGGAAGFLFVFGAWARADFLLGQGIWALIGMSIAALLLGAAFAGRTRHDAEPPAAMSSGALSAGAAFLLLFAADRLYDGVWYTLAIAALSLFFAISAGLMRVMWQGLIASALGTLATIRLFASRQLWTEDLSLPLGAHWILYGYGLPALAFLAGSRFLRKAGYLRSAVSLEGISLGLVISLASLEIRVLIGGGVTAQHPQLLEMAAHILTWLGAAYGLLYRQRIYSGFIAAWGAKILLGVSVLAIVAVSLIGLNPVLTRDTLQGGVFFNALLLAYLAPAVLLWLISRSLSPLKLEVLRPAVETLAVGLVAVYLSLEFKRFYAGPILGLEPKDEFEAAIQVLISLGLAVLLVYRGGFLSEKGVEWSGRALVGVSVFAIVTGGLGLYNPVVSGLPLLGNAVFNTLLLTYLAPIALIALLVPRLDALRWRHIAPLAGGLCLLLVFAYVTLETKRIFQGPVMTGWSQSPGESYAYSAVWLALALALFVAGIRLGRKVVRYAGLAVMVLVVVKVFLLDMSGLEGLYRIASFIGLGLCLVGIGWLYQRFVHQPEPVKP